MITSSRVLCLVCRSAANSNEHYISQWLSKATSRKTETVIRGTALNGVVTSAYDNGTGDEAFERNLCDKCNRGLGSLLENPVSRLLKPLIAGNYTLLNTWGDAEKYLISWWAILHAIEHDYLDPRLDVGPKGELLDNLKTFVDGGKPALPGDLHVHVAIGEDPEWGFYVTKQLLSNDHRSVNTVGSFFWVMQANHLILALARIPGARLDMSQGWGFAIQPPGYGTIQIYRNLNHFVSSSRISLR